MSLVRRIVVSAWPDASKGAILADWHPILNAIEVAAGEWFMPDPLGEPYAVVRLLEVHGERGYRVVTYAPERGDRRLIGYYKNLRAATMGANQWFTSTRARGQSQTRGGDGAARQAVVAGRRRVLAADETRADLAGDWKTSCSTRDMRSRTSDTSSSSTSIVYSAKSP
jgi:hypothetical protein